MSQSRQPTGPLAGVRVVEFRGLGPVPFAGMLLSDLGADVVRVDRTVDVGRDATAPDVLGRNRRSIALDLKSDDGRALALELVKRADILLEGFRPGAMERLGLGPEPCLEWRPELVYGRATGWGQEGPLAESAGHDLNYIALSGALAAIGSAGGSPQIPLALVGDFGGGGMLLAFGVVSALNVARTTGVGQVVDASIVDAVALTMTTFTSKHARGEWSLDRGTNLVDGGRPFYDVYQCRDGGYVSVGSLEPEFYAGLLRALDLTDVDPARQHDPSDWDILRERLRTTFLTRTRDEWVRFLADEDICVAPVLDMAEAPQHPHHAQRGTYVEVDGLLQGAPAPRFSRTPGAIVRPPVRAGEHTAEVLDELGLLVDDIERLRKVGAAR